MLDDRKEVECSSNVQFSDTKYVCTYMELRNIERHEGTQGAGWDKDNADCNSSKTTGKPYEYIFQYRYCQRCDQRESYITKPNFNKCNMQLQLLIKIHPMVLNLVRFVRKWRRSYTILVQIYRYLHEHLQK
jgi:hypothetical protein